MQRMTARSFRARFHKVDEPVLVGEGIWFPKVDSVLLTIAEKQNERRKEKEKKADE